MAKTKKKGARQSAFDFGESKRRANVGMDRAATKAPAGFAQAMLTVVIFLAETRTTFFMDDVWAKLEKTHPRYCVKKPSGSYVYGDSSGHVMKRARAEGIIRETGRRAKSARPSAQSKSMPVYTGSRAVECSHCHGTGYL